MKVDFKAVKSFLIEELAAELIYLFGSYAKESCFMLKISGSSRNLKCWL